MYTSGATCQHRSTMHGAGGAAARGLQRLAGALLLRTGAASGAAASPAAASIPAACRQLSRHRAQLVGARLLGSSRPIASAAAAATAAAATAAHAPPASSGPGASTRTAPPVAAPSFQDAVRRLQDYWARAGCLVWLPHNTEVGAGTMNPATFLRCVLASPPPPASLCSKSTGACSKCNRSRGSMAEGGVGAGCGKSGESWRICGMAFWCPPLHPSIQPRSAALHHVCIHSFVHSLAHTPCLSIISAVCSSLNTPSLPLVLCSVSHSVLGPEPWSVAYPEPSIRPDDSRYGDNPNRVQRHTQFQVILKPDPGNAQAR